MTRDSVAPGDDADAPHARTFSLPDGLSPLQVISHIVAARYLASIANGQATWSVVSGVPLAVVAEQWPAPKLVLWPDPALSDLEQKDKTYRLHFNYHMQRDPELILQVLKELQLHAL